MGAPKDNKYAAGNKGGTGRPPRYKKEFDKQCGEMCRRGFIDDDLAAVFGVTVTTIKNWKHNHKSFLASVQENKPTADANVKSSLYHRAIGGIKSVETRTTVDPSGQKTVTTIEKTSIPETAACIFWLTNRDGENWKRSGAAPDNGDNEAPPLSFSFQVQPAVKDMQITNAKTI